MRNHIGAAIAVALLSSSTQALSQTTVSQPEISRLHLARELILGEGMADRLRNVIRTYYSSLHAQVMNSIPAEQRATYDAVFSYVSDEEVKSVPQLLDDVATVYANHLTERELRDSLAWAQTESGRSIKAKMPAITQEMALILAVRATELMKGEMAVAVTHVCDERKCSAEQRQAMAATINGMMAKTPS